MERLIIKQRSYYDLPNSAFWGWLYVESQPQNPEFRNNPENFHLCHKQWFQCISTVSKFDIFYSKMIISLKMQKIHYLTLTPRSRSHKMLPSALYIMWSMHQQSLMLLHPTVKEKIHLQESALFDLDLGFKVTRNVAQCPLHYVTYAPATFPVTMYLLVNASSH